MENNTAYDSLFIEDGKYEIRAYFFCGEQHLEVYRYGELQGVYPLADLHHGKMLIAAFYELWEYQNEEEN